MTASLQILSISPFAALQSDTVSRLGSLNGREFLEYLSDYQLPKDSAPWSLQAGSCERGNEPSLKGYEFLEYLSDYQLLKKDSAPWSQFRRALVSAVMNFP
jgi:hypothetical protein